MINSFNGWDTLKEVMLGDVYPSDFYYDHSPEVRQAFEIITEMTKNDLDKIQKILEYRGIIVHRPNFTNNRDDYLDDQGLLIKPPIMPRDTELVLGNDFFHLRMDYKKDPWNGLIKNIQNKGSRVHQGPRSTGLACLCPPSIIRCGRDLYVDYDTHQHIWDHVSSIFLDWSKNYRLHLISTGGHSDGVFCPIRPGVIIASHWLKVYDQTFPGWEIYHLTPEKNENKQFQKWWIPDKNVSSNGLFSEHIEKYAVDWIGNYQETQFSVNMLVLDQKTVLAVNDNPSLFDFLSSKGIEVIVSDFKCKSFWDGGMHCLTCDLVRDGHKQDYFPDRPDFNYSDWM